MTTTRAPATGNGHTIDSDGDDNPVDHSALNPEIQSWQQAADQSIQYRSEQHRELGIEHWSGVVDLLGLTRLRQLSVNYVDFHFFPRPK